MNITIANISTQVNAVDLQAAVAAIGLQVANEFKLEWGVSATLTGNTAPLSGQAPITNIQDAVIYLGDSSQDPTTGVGIVLGYHFQNQAKIPYGFVYLDICAQYGERWITTLSHEVLELLADPDAVLTISGPAPNGTSGTVYYDLEVCDPTQGDTYLINNLAVSNFVGRSYFGLSGGTGQINYRNLPLAAFGIRPGGYLQYEDNNGAHQIQGNLVTPRQLAAKRSMKLGRRNARRQDRIANRVQNLAAPPQPAARHPVKSNSALLFFGLAILMAVVCAVASLPHLFSSGANVIIIEGALLAAMCLIGLAVAGRPLGVLINENNLMSMSRLQLIIWTVVIVGSYAAYALARVQMPAADQTGVWQPLAVNIDDSLLVLLGISSTSFVAAPAILRSKANKEPSGDALTKTSLLSGDSAAEIISNSNGILYANTSAKDAKLTDVFQGDEVGDTMDIDLAKVQLFFFTIIAACAYLICVIKAFKTATPDLGSLPAIPQQLNVILGISHASYLGSKSIVHTPLKA